MWVFSNYLEQTGTIIYEKDQVVESGLLAYGAATSYKITADTRFAVLRRDTFTRKSDETHRSEFDELTVHFGMNEKINLEASGIYLRPGRTRLVYDGVEFRAVTVNDFAAANRQYLPLGVIEVKFRKRRPIAN